MTIQETGHPAARHRRPRQSNLKHTSKDSEPSPVITEMDLHIPGLTPNQLPLGSIPREMALKLARRDVAQENERARKTHAGFNARRRELGVPEVIFTPPLQPTHDDLGKIAERYTTVIHGINHSIEHAPKEEFILVKKESTG